ncbi:hypothetical protein C9374_006184 [Naegleria lovaniensis]|uniref:CSC1/OSCA1-like cytosolic domain-containing protein n=1 Tax=Naegleria lovaniensis TaxID=51637 RepID=A0AA88KJQ8_NAELO|nr:uncharacterized protein C9374_006184 [Naegleria lovaniensis]KAG2381800.1 hypothetical protein C9374_006184 [Naegleria lovaniensis]
MTTTTTTGNGLNLTAARQHASRMYYTKPKTTQKYSFFCTPFTRFVQLGRSTMLYLYFSLMVVIFFVVLSALHAPYLYFYYQKSNPSFFFQASMANFSLGSSGGVNIAFGAIEIAISIFSIVYLRFLYWFSKRMNDKVAKRTISVADYSVHVRDLPSTEAVHGKKRLYKHFSKFGPIDNIALALDSGNLSKSLKRKEELIKDIEKCDIIIQRGECFSSLIERIKRYYFTQLLNWTRKDIAKSMRKKAYRCTGDAFITFVNEKARFQCLHTFNKPQIQKLCSKKGTYSKKRHRIRVEPAHEPHDIIWENLEYSVISKYSRRSVSSIFTILFSAAVVAVAVVLEVVKKDKFADTSITEWIKNPSFQNWQIFASIGMSVLVFILVQVLTYTLYLFSNFEKHRFILNAKQSLMMKVTFGSFFTTIAYLFVYLQSPTPGTYYSEITDNSVIIPKGAIYLGSTYIPIIVESSAFYSSIFFVTCTSIASNVIKDALLVVYHHFLRKYKVATSVTQSDLMKAVEPPRYSYEYRYSYQLKNMFIGLLFSGLFPLSLMMITIGLVLCYFIDKFNVLKVYRAEGKEVDLLSPTAINFLSFGMLMRYILMSITRIYFTISLNYDPSTTNQPVLSIITPYHICFFSAFLLYLIFLMIHWMTTGTNFIQKYLCCPPFRYPNYITRNGEKPIHDYRDGFDKYVAPVDVQNVKYVYHGEELESVDYEKKKQKDSTQKIAAAL